MKITKSTGKLILKAGLIENMINSSAMIARKLEFDYVRQTLTITRGKIRKEKTSIPFSNIRKIFHRMYGQEDNFLNADNSENSGGQSSLSIVFFDIIDMPNETVYIQSYERAGKSSMEARKIIVKIQAIVDEISHFIWKPVVIECKEIGFFIDMEKNQMLLNGLFLPLSKVWLVQTVETDRGYYAVEVYTSGGDVYVTTEGRDKTLYVSETVKMVAERANIPFQRVRNREVRYPFRDFPYMEKVKIEDWRMRTRRITNRFFTDKGDGSIEKVLDTERS